MTEDTSQLPRYNVSYQFGKSGSATVYSFHHFNGPRGQTRKSAKDKKEALRWAKKLVTGNGVGRSWVHVTEDGYSHKELAKFESAGINK